MHSRHFEQVYRFCRKRNVWPLPDLSAPVMAPWAAFALLDLPDLPTVAALAEWLLLPVERLEYLADVHNRHEAHGDTAVNHYHYMLKPKKSGGLRVIEAPKTQLKAAQRRILRGILNKVPIHDDAFGFALGRNCIDGASRHVGEEMLVCFDLKDFFPSVHLARVHGHFRSLGYPVAVARHLTGLCTNAAPPRIIARLHQQDRANYKTLHLPQGSPASPALANQIAFTLDKRLAGLARSLGGNFSRYADDLSFSGDRAIKNTLLHAVPKIVRQEGFALNAAKTRTRHQADRQCVTGIVVNQHLNVGRETFDRLKAIIHACARPQDRRLADSGFCAVLLGKIDWVERVNPHRGAKLKKHLAAALDKRGP